MFQYYTIVLVPRLSIILCLSLGDIYKSLFWYFFIILICNSELFSELFCCDSVCNFTSNFFTNQITSCFSCFINDFFRRSFKCICCRLFSMTKDFLALFTAQTFTYIFTHIFTHFFSKR